MSSALPCSPAAPRTPAAIPRISTQRAWSFSKRVRAPAGSPSSMATSEGVGGCADARLTAAAFPAACTFASIAARKRGTDTRPAR